MGDVQIAAVDHRLFLIQFPDVLSPRILPRHTVRKTLQLILGVRHIDGQDVVVRKFRGDHTPLMIMLFDPHAIGHGQRLLLRKKRRAGIALLLRIVPVHVVARKVQLQLPLLQLRLLQTEDIRIQALEHLHEVLPHDRPKPVHIPRNHFLHIVNSSVYLSNSEQLYSSMI